MGSVEIARLVGKRVQKRIGIMLCNLDRELEESTEISQIRMCFDTFYALTKKCVDSSSVYLEVHSKYKQVENKYFGAYRKVPVLIDEDVEFLQFKLDKIV